MARTQKNKATVELNGYIQLKFMKGFIADAKARTIIASTVKAIVDGRIGNGEIYKGKLKDGSLVAIRCLKLKKRHTTHNFFHQIEPISKFRHHNLVNALGHCFKCYLDDSSVSRIFIVFEYVPNGTLRDCISDYTRVTKFPIVVAPNWPDIGSLAVLAKSEKKGQSFIDFVFPYYGYFFLPVTLQDVLPSRLSTTDFSRNQVLNNQIWAVHSSVHA
ncbi:hypothetical protein Syun_025047 [Stephania yunnanensis]|uniref:Serine-threonine/tyrosine-protein kinase catalytic domain-containing protein n=1 Tax=Stephania yunnanensis TaxID=152371 RepID=A0AAP0ETW3_9MAGN